MKFTTVYGRFYLIPSVSLTYDHYYEGGLAYLDFDIVWGRWGISITLKKEA